jgi:mannosyltransferase
MADDPATPSGGNPDVDGDWQKMTGDPSSARQVPATLIVLASILSLSVLILLLIEHSIRAQHGSLTIILLVLFVLLSILFLRVSSRPPWRQLPDTRSVGPHDLSYKMAVLLLVACTFIGAALRLYDLGQESLWVDEVWTAEFATQPLGTVVGSNAPLAYSVAHFTLLVSRSEFALRFASALAGIALIPAAYLVGQILYGRKEGLVAAALLSVSVYAIEHSQEVRFYAWQMLFSTLTLYFLIRGLERGHWRDWAGFALTTALNLYSHPFAVFVVASEGLYTLWFLVGTSFRTGNEIPIPLRKKLHSLFHRSLPPLAAALAAFVAFIPLWSRLLRFNNSLWVVSTARGQHLPLGMENVSWLSYPVAFGTYGMLAEYLNLRSVPFLVYPALAIFFLGLLSARRHTVLILLWFLVPIPILLVMKYWLQPRYLSYFLPLFLFVTARGITWLSAALAPRRIKEGILLAALTGLVALPSLVQLPAYYVEPQEDQWREVTAFVEANYQAGDVVLITSAYDPTPLPFEWYATVPASELPRQVFPEGPETGVLTHLEQLDSLPPVTQGRERVWFVFNHVGAENQALIVGAMRGFQVVDEWHFVGLDLLLFERRSPEADSRTACGLCLFCVRKD